MSQPTAVRVLRTLGSGRAACAQLVEATMADGSTALCVEKVFAPGRLTRLIYRLAFAAPFAYQANRDAILASFYRRRVAAAVLATSNLDVQIASPRYVRFCDETKAWVLAADWIDGRGIRPEPADPQRWRSWRRGNTTSERIAEVDQLVTTMRATEARLIESGLTGSGWQVSPRALVSTANLLRRDHGYTIVDLESGIPAVLVPKYIMAGIRSGTAPPFDDLDRERLRQWLAENEKLVTFRLGTEAAAMIGSDVERLIEHTERWKDSELAPLRRPWRLVRPGGLQAYQNATIEHWRRTGILDEQTALEITHRSGKGRAIWWAKWIPTIVGTMIAKLIGNRQSRQHARRFLSNRLFRRARWHHHLECSRRRWIASGRITESPPMTTPRYVIHRSLSMLPRSVHRFLSDSKHRRYLAISCVLLLLSGRYQSWLGQTHITTAINRWVDAKRISSAAGQRLKQDARGSEIRAYSRGFGMHVALKFLAPIVIPAKIGSVMAFLANGNGWFLVPLAATPLLRVVVTIGNWIHSRQDQVRHREAFAVSWLPFVGSIAFPLQMYASRPELATFLIRDTASRLGCRLPIYGGSDSRTELACIRATDSIIETLDVATGLTGANQASRTLRLYQVETPAAESSKAGTRLGRWIDQLADQRIRSESDRAEIGLPQPSTATNRIAA